MWPLDLPAIEVLRLPGETTIPWAVFDWRWYLRIYPDVASIFDASDPQAMLAYYLDFGQIQGHSPNLMFDEEWHRRTYPQIAEKIAAGQWRSAFDAYCRRGALDRSPHWLFDEPGYRERYPALTDQVLNEFELCNGYDHFLRHGAGEDRIGHVLFDPVFYLANFDPADVPAIRENGVFQHYLNRIEAGEFELHTSIYFDPDWYKMRYPEVAREIEMKQWKSALHHYICNTTPTAFDPLASFSEVWYLQHDPGLLEVISARSFRNGYMHFLRFGAKELRPPAASIDLAWYATQRPVRADLENGRASDPFTHWLTIGAPEGKPSAKSAAESMTAAQARELFHQTATAWLPMAGRFGYCFDCGQEPSLSVVIVVRNGFAATMAAIASLRSNTASDIELIVVDLGSDDETKLIGHYLPGAKILRLERDIGWSRAADAGRQLCAGQVILFLSAQAQIAPGSVERACARLTEDPSIGAVGGMILQPHGLIAAAGGILWNSGGTHDYMRDAAATQPEANFVRIVDFCAPAFLMVRTALLTRLDGFDHDCSAGYETVDLCLRIAEAGFQVIYDPSVMIIESDLSRADGPGDHFLHKHEAVLASRFSTSGPLQVFARHTGPQPHRVLFIEDTVPLRRIGSGFVRANDLVRVMVSLGYAVTVFPMNVCDHDIAQIYGDMPDSVEVMHTLSLDRLAAFLNARPGYYNTVWVARTHNLAHTKSILTVSIADGTLDAQIVLDTEAVTPHREAILSELKGESYDLRGEMQALRADAEICQKVVAVTEAEAQSLRWYGFPQVSVIGHAIDPKPTPRPFSQRSGLLFVGAIHKQDSPNLDSLIWFVDAVLPLIEAELKWETRLTIAGYVAPGVDLGRFEKHPRITVRGPIANLDPLYDAHRVFVAPTRFAAGAPYKVLEAASRGVPVAATEILREQLDWTPDQHMLSAPANDPEAFTANVLALYRNAVVWQSIRDGALGRLQEQNALAGYADSVRSVVTPGPES